MQSALIAILAVLDLILGVILYVTIRQIQIIDQAINSIDATASKAANTSAQNNKRIEACYTAIQLCSRDTSEAYTLAAECRNELTRMHMAMRKENAE